ncbi:hypothetical protein N2152v2_009141 [Parachlorella kessleri]
MQRPFAVLQHLTISIADAYTAGQQLAGRRVLLSNTSAASYGNCPLRDHGYPYWGWGGNSGRCCKTSDNHNCAGEWVGGVLTLPGAPKQAPAQAQSPSQQVSPSTSAYPRAETP